MVLWLNYHQKMSITQVMPQDIIPDIFAYLGTYSLLDANNPKYFPWYLLTMEDHAPVNGPAQTLCILI